jgi:ubiquinone/menaquinone biosynthesis C-methylase UbiE
MVSAAQSASQNDSLRYVCPECKGDLTDLYCKLCNAEYSQSGPVFNFLPRGTRFGQARDISATYDSVYTDHARVWEDQGRERDFRDYFAKLARELSGGRLLEIGCGEGILLEVLQAREKFAVDISTTALKKTNARTGANCAVAIAEMLPYPTASFDLVVSVGVMEHFLDEDQANREIHRVLKPGGHYLVLIHVEMNFRQRLMQKVREFIFPIPRPVRLAKWIVKKMRSPIHQPIQIDYTVASAQASLERGNLAVQNVISLASKPKPPLAGHHVIIYVARKA